MGETIFSVHAKIFIISVLLLFNWNRCSPLYSTPYCT